MSKAFEFVNVKAEIITAETEAADRKIVEDFYRRIPVMQRHATVDLELVWYLTQVHNSTSHKKRLPDYCYNIFEKYSRTQYRALPKESETLTGDTKGVEFCKTVEEEKKIVKIDWARLGTLFGIGIRGMRFVELEAENCLKREGVGVLMPENGGPDMALIFDKARLEKMCTPKRQFRDTGSALVKNIKDENLTFIEKLPSLVEYFTRIAYEWGDDALEDWYGGLRAGVKGFLDKNGQLVGESPRANKYEFLLQAWPEIKEMLDATPKKTVSDLHAWMLPFMRRGITSLLDVDALRDICAPMPGGIGLALRPLTSRSASSSD